MAKNTATEAARITPQDIENKLRALQGDVQQKVDDQRSTIATAAAAGGIVLLLIFFFLGKRSGKKRSTIVEIRRI
jgi:CHASE3 domain sensor protein